MATRKQAFEALKALNPAPVFLQSYQDERLPENLDIFFRPPEELFLAPETQTAYTQGRLIPILDDGNFGIVTFYDPSTGSLIQKDVESPAEIRAQFHNWQQYLAHLVVRIAETVDDETRVERMATLLQFKYCNEVFAFLDEVATEPYERYHSKRQKFISDLKP
jgi:hypothetical protein